MEYIVNLLGAQQLLGLAPTAPQAPHADLVNTLTDFYKLMNALGAFSEDVTTEYPPPETGIHGPENFNASAASEAGLSPSAVEAMSKLPYLELRNLHDNDQVSILPSTYPESYLGANWDASSHDRCMVLDVTCEEQMPPQSFRLTSTSIYGYLFVYDADTELVHPWKPFESEENSYYEIRGVPAHEAFGPMMEAWRTLTYFATSRGQDFDWAGDGTLNPDWEPQWQKSWLAGHEVDKAASGIRKLYVEHGWDRDSLEQPSFDREAFLESRDAYWRDVVEPLEQHADAVTKWARSL